MLMIRTLMGDSVLFSDKQVIIFVVLFCMLLGTCLVGRCSILSH